MSYRSCQVANVGGGYVSRNLQESMPRTYSDNRTRKYGRECSSTACINKSCAQIQFEDTRASLPCQPNNTTQYHHHLTV